MSCARHVAFLALAVLVLLASALALQRRTVTVFWEVPREEPPARQKEPQSCCQHVLQALRPLRLPKLKPDKDLRVKWPEELPRKSGDVLEIVVQGKKPAKTDRNVFVWLKSSDGQLASEVLKPKGSQWRCEVKLLPGQWTVHVLVVALGKPFRFAKAKGSPQQLTVVPKGRRLPQRRCKLGVDELQGRWVRSNASCAFGCPRDGWTLVSPSCHWHVHSPAEVYEKTHERQLWLAILGNSVMRGSLQALVDQLVPKAWQSFAGKENVPGRGTTMKCWGWLDFQVGGLRLSFQDYRIWFYTEEGTDVALKRLKRLISEAPDLLVIQHYGPDVAAGRPPLVYQSLLTSMLPGYLEKRKRGKIIFALSKRSPFMIPLCNPLCSDSSRPRIWNRSIEALLAKLPNSVRTGG